MSKERELLKRWLAGEANQMPTHVPLLIETQNLLAQPEQPNEPVAWKGRTYGNLHHVDYGNSIPLYASPPKREPLSNLAIKEAGRNAKDMSFYNGVKWAEAQHNIGVDDE